jgi:O-acetyl-ADP-ribose deacetylase (regulator of RNase III)
VIIDTGTKSDHAAAAGHVSPGPVDFKKGNILRATTEALVNPVHCVGVMGRGLAAQFKREYPANFEAYEVFEPDDAVIAEEPASP